MSETLQHGDLTLPLPAGWYDATHLLAVGPEENGFRPNLTVTTQPALEGMTAEQYAANFKLGLTKQLKNYELLSEGPARFGALSGYLLEHTFEQSGVKVGQLQLCVVQGGVARSFTYTQRASRLETSRVFAETLLGSVQLQASLKAFRPR